MAHDEIYSDKTQRQALLAADLVELLDHSPELAQAAVEQYLHRCSIVIDVDVETVDDGASLISSHVRIVSPKGEVLLSDAFCRTRGGD